jgi:hypothetical protein
VQVDPIRPTLTAPGTWRLELIYHESLSNAAFNFNLRRYIMDASRYQAEAEKHGERSGRLAAQASAAVTEAGAYTRPLFRST